jgi:hypothetical protein
VRAAIIGDVSGWCHSLETALREIGCDPDEGTIPEDLVVVQVGDLVHKGADSRGCLALVDRMLLSGRWIQLMGNHEAQYLGGPVFWHEERIPYCVADLQRWTAEGQLKLAYAYDTEEYGPILITHAGLVVAKWEELGALGDVHAVARAINAEFIEAPERALAAGSMLGRTDCPGVTWSDPIAELLVPWSHFPTLPFSQVHGHASPYLWADPMWRETISEVNDLVIRGVDIPQRRTIASWPGGQTIIGIDPGFGTKGPQVPLVPFPLHLASNDGT